VRLDANEQADLRWTTAQLSRHPAGEAKSNGGVDVVLLALTSDDAAQC